MIEQHGRFSLLTFVINSVLLLIIMNLSHGVNESVTVKFAVEKYTVPRYNKCIKTSDSSSDTLRGAGRKQAERKLDCFDP